MAKIKLNSLLVDIRGRLGNNVFSSNGAGFYCKVMKIPVNPRSVSQSAVRSTFSFLVKGWSLLDQSDRDDWVTYAAQADNVRYDWFGDPYYPSGRSQFIIVNSARLQSGLAVTDTPPVSTLPLDLPTFSCGVDPQTVSFASYMDPDDVFDASIAYVHAALCCVSSVARQTPVLPLRFLGVQPVGYAWPWLFNSLVLDLYGSILTSGRGFLALTPYSSECRPGTVARYSAALGEEIAP